jgi:predicted sulfurtransferase
MAHAFQVPATAFSRGFGKYRDEVHNVGVIEVTSHDRVVGAYISPKELEHFKRLKQRERQVIHVSEVDDELLAAIENAQYGEVSE